MKCYKAGNTVPPGSLAANFLPADYVDVYACETDAEGPITPDDVMVGFWRDSQSAWVGALFRLRNFAVRFVGLKGSKGFDPNAFERAIREGGTHGFVSIPAKDANETVMLMDDRHLDAYLSVRVENRERHRAVSVITLVRFKIGLGRLYFFVIRPFHGIIAKHLLRRAVEKAMDGDKAVR
jgi:hypothetical protein